MGGFDMQVETTAISEIHRLIPQRHPFLFVDEMTGFDGKSVETRLKLSGHEDFFKGHFPGNPIMPGVLLQEALFQTGALLMARRQEEAGTAPGLGVIAKVENARFRQLVRPGDELVMRVDLIEDLGTAFVMKGETRVGGKLAAAVQFTCAEIRPF